MTDHCHENGPILSLPGGKSLKHLVNAMKYGETCCKCAWSLRESEREQRQGKKERAEGKGGRHFQS